MAKTNFDSVEVDDVALVSPTAVIIKAIEGDLIAGTGTSGGELLALANPEGVPLLILDFIVDITTQATGGATGDFGVAAGATTSGDTLLDGIDIGAAPIVGDNIEDGGTNGGGVRKWAASEFITGTPSATAAGLVGTYKVVYCVQ